MIERFVEALQARLARRRVVDSETLRRVAGRYKARSAGGGASDVRGYIESIALPGGKAYRLDTHDDLIAIAEDPARLVVVRKAAQKGVTELMIRLQFWLASRGYNTAYFLKSRAYMRTMVQSRVEPVIGANPELLRALSPEDKDEIEADVKAPAKYRLTDNTTLKRMYGANLLYMGLQSEADVRSFPLDAIFVDEVETLKPELTAALQERLYHSELKWERWFSQPTAVGYGIDEKFQLTDQRHQVFRCEGCGAEFVLEESFPECMGWVDDSGRVVPLGEAIQGSVGGGVGGSYRYICPRCRRVFEPLRASWRWVAKYPSRSADGHGYHLTQLYSRTMAADEVARLYRLALRSPLQMERFYNSVLGLPYAGGDTQPISPERLAYHGHGLSPVDGDAPRYAGVDVGDTLSLVIIESRGAGVWWVVGVYELKGAGKWDDLRGILQNWRVGAFGVNAMPYKDSAKRLIRDLSPAIEGVLVYDLSDDAKPSVGVEDEEFGEPVPKLTYPRVELMDGTVHALLGHAVWLPPRGLSQTERLLGHLQNYIVERDAQGRRRYARGREDHLGRALDYALAAARWRGAGYLPPDALTPDKMYTPIRLEPRVL